jgi:sterol desaturase/sphingolipid hydroxylase (fatty acid hydroxylase superfamily)
MEEILGPLIPLSFLGMLVLEHFFSARKLPRVRFWLWKGLLFFSFTGVVNALLPALIATVLAGRTLLDLRGLGMLPGALLGAVVADFFGYWLHRAMHTSHWLWRWTHQMHHSAERMDLAGMSYSHPFDTLLAFSLTGLATTLLGLSPDAAALAGFLGYATAVFQHMNIRTPSWIGRIVMRPEAHGLHHERGIHAYNYASFPLWDIVFGTFRQVQSFPEHYGFWPGASAKMGAMLIGRDVGLELGAPMASELARDLPERA